MSEKEAIKETIKHWERMIRWAKERDKSETVNPHNMVLELKEWWNGEHCPLCEKFGKRSCGKCPPCRTCGVCSGQIYIGTNLWGKVNSSLTWGEWTKECKIIFKTDKEFTVKKSFGRLK
jgi:hypothetical protein